MVNISTGLETSNYSNIIKAFFPFAAKKKTEKKKKIKPFSSACSGERDLLHARYSQLARVSPLEDTPQMCESCPLLEWDRAPESPRGCL